MKRLLNLIFPDRLQFAQLNTFMYFPGEKLILATREHWLPLGIRLIKQATIIIFISLFASGALYYLFRSPLLSLAGILLLALGGTEFMIQQLVHWHFHIYLLTNHKLLEIKYDPLFSEETNSVLLDQIRCTEIDAELHGIISELLDIGNVAITFDRPTHQEVFMLKNVRSPRKIATVLSSELNKTHGQQNQNTIWYRDHENKYKYIEGESYGIPAIN